MGSALVRELRRLGFEGKVIAVGGKRLAAEGAEIVADSSEWGVIGILQALKIAPNIFGALPRIKRSLAESRPSLVIPIDFGFFNVRLCSIAKRNALRVLYFMPPGSWRRHTQGNDLPTITDAIATPFEWSANLLTAAGANAVWVGHPVLQLAGEISDGERNLVAILPGSRRHEIELNTPMMARSLAKCNLHGLSVVAVCAPGADSNRIKSLWERNCTIPLEVSQQRSFDVLKRAKAALVCSGTATLEAAVCKTPMVVIYQATFLMALQWYLVRKRVKFISMPSILLDRQVVPEVLGYDVSDKVACALNQLLTDTHERALQIQAFEEVRAVLGPPDAITRTAQMAMKMLETVT